MITTLLNPTEEEMNENLMSNLVKNSYFKPSTISKCCELYKKKFDKFRSTIKPYNFT